MEDNHQKIKINQYKLLIDFLNYKKYREYFFLALQYTKMSSKFKYCVTK